MSKMAFVSGRKSSNAQRRNGMQLQQHLLRASCSFAWLALLLLFASPWMIDVEASAPVPNTEEVAVEAEASSTKQTTKTARFVHKTIIIPHDSKKFRGGEDAASTIDTMLVVADGVGGWANKGVNPGLYSRKLTETITASFLAMSPEEQADVDLKDLVHKSNHIAADAHLGSATCTVVRLKDAITLETINVGDSGYSIHRRTKPDASGLEVVYASIPGQKGFNFPYQLGGRYGDQVDEPNVTDGPNTHKLQDKDVIVVVSDGIIDNIDPEEYHSCIQRYQWSDDIDWPTRADLDASHPNYFADSELVSHSAVADCIARKAYFLGKDKTYFSPFARSAATYGKRYLGGKHDDITVVVAQVSSTTTAAAPAKLDPHRAESIFLYKDSDGPIRSPKALPTMDEILRGILESVGGDPVAAEL